MKFLDIILWPFRAIYNLIKKLFGFGNSTKTAEKVEEKPVIEEKKTIAENAKGEVEAKDKVKKGK